LKFDEFEASALRDWEKVPAEFKRGVDRLVLERDARAHHDLDEIYTLGECITEDFPSDFGGPDTTRSAVVLYYGSFLRLSHLDADFDWEREIWETLTHELQHHLEALADEDSLEDFDYAVDENYKRLNGELFDPLFFRAGEPIDEGRYQVERDVFIELDPGVVAGNASWIEFDWDGSRYRLLRPALSADVHYLRVSSGPDLDGGDLWVVLVPRRGVFNLLRDAIRRQPLEVSEAEAVAELVP
jgi:hypothetical protein